MMLAIITPYYGMKSDPHFKRKGYLASTIQSVDRQNLDLIHMIVDDGSDDRATDEIGPGVHRRVILKRPRREQDKLTCANAINYGLEKLLNSDIAKDVTYVTFLHSDDLAANYDRRIKYMKAENLHFCYSNAVIFQDGSNDGIIWEGINGPVDRVRKNFWAKGRLPYLTMTWSLEMIKDLKGYIYLRFGRREFMDSSIGCGEDVDIALITLDYAKVTGKKVEFFDEITGLYRIHDSSLAEIRDKNERRKEERMVIERHFGRHGASFQYAKRLILRPECTFPFLYPYVLSKRKRHRL